MTTIIGVASLVSLALTGCSSTGNKDASHDDSKDMKMTASTPVKAVASTTQICDYITQFAQGDKDNAELAIMKTNPNGKKEELGAKPDKAKTTLDLTCLLEPNASAHEHEMTQQQSQALSEADLFFVSGVDLEHFLDEAVKATNFKGKMVVTSGVYTADEVKDLKAQEAKEKDLPYKVVRGVAKVDVAKWPFPPEAGEKEPEFQYDPHVWTSPKNAIVQVKNIGAALEEASPESKETFAKHVDGYVKKLEELDNWAKESIDSVPVGHRVLFTSHDAFGYFSKTYGVKFEGAALSDFSDQQDATAEKIAETVKKVKDSGAVAIFAENSNNPKSVEKVAQEAKVKAIIGDDALYGDSLGPANTDGETYIGSILHNVTNLVKAWDGKVADIPESLKAFAPRETH